MELAIGLIIIVGVGVIWYFNAQKEKQVAESQPEAPYKLEPPVPATAPVVEAKAEVVAEAKPASPAKAKKTTAKKAKTTTAKTPAKKTPKLKVSK